MPCCNLSPLFFISACNQHDSAVACPDCSVAEHIWSILTDHCHNSLQPPHIPSSVIMAISKVYMTQRNRCQLHCLLLCHSATQDCQYSARTVSGQNIPDLSARHMSVHCMSAFWVTAGHRSCVARSRAPVSGWAQIGLTILLLYASTPQNCID